MAKPYATSAELIAENPDTGVKMYVIKYVDSKGELQETSAQGVGMRDALQTVIKQAQKERLKSVPQWVWMIGVIGLISSFSVAAMTAEAPTLTILGGLFGMVALHLALQKHFKHTR